MGANKKWKRKANRWKGTCISLQNCCNKCKYIEKCINSIYGKYYIPTAPSKCGINQLREECKGIE